MTMTEFTEFTKIFSALTLIIEAVDSIYRCTLMVSTQQKEVLWILDLVR